MNKALHIISFDVPSPPDYGGVIDVYYRAKALKSAGVYIILHCFAYGRDKTQDLTAIADEVFYYDRPKRLIDQLSPLPFIVKSRMNEELNKRLLKDQNPILMEGHHSSALLLDRRFKKRKLFVRVHNIEHEYYQALALAEKNFFKSLYFKLEAKKLKRYDQFLKRADALFCLSNSDLNYYKLMNHNSHLWDIGINIETIVERPEQKRMALFQGNLSVQENQQAVLNLFELWNKHQLNLPLIVAGKNPPSWLKEKLSANAAIQLVANPSDEQLFSLIREAQFNLSISENKSGTKIKLLHNLLHGNRCIANNKILEGLGLESEIEIVNSDESLITILVKTNFIEDSERLLRQERILKRFDPNIAVIEILPLLFPKE